MWINPRLMRDTLTIELISPPEFDPNTGASIGGAETTTVILSQPCSDQDVRYKQRRAGVEDINGIPGSPPVSICYTRAYQLPALGDGQLLRYRVNGRVRPMLRQGPPLDVGGQHEVWQLELGAPEGGRDAP